MSINIYLSRVVHHERPESNKALDFKEVESLVGLLSVKNIRWYDGGRRCYVGKKIDVDCLGECRLLCVHVHTMAGSASASKRGGIFRH